MKTLSLAKRCTKEILRDKLNIIFGLGFPLTLLFLLSAMQKNIPNDLFSIDTLAPGISIFGLSFITLFSSTLISKDRESEFLTRLYTAPIKAHSFIISYMFPLIPLSLFQAAICYLAAIPLGITPTWNIFLCLIAILPISILYIGLGLFFGSFLNTKQVGGICGALLTNLSAWLSGIWFDVALVGEGFAKIANLLPFVHAVNLERNLLSGNFDSLIFDIYPILIYDIIVCIGAILVFIRQMKKQ